MLVNSSAMLSKELVGPYGAAGASVLAKVTATAMRNPACARTFRGRHCLDRRDLYPVLHWMEAKRLVESEWKRRNAARRKYIASEEGRKALQVWRSKNGDRPHYTLQAMENTTHSI